MSFLNGLFSIISVVFLIVLLLGLIKPSWVKMQTRGKAFMYFFSGMIIFSTLHFLTLSDEDKEKIKAESKAETVVQQLEQDKRLDPVAETKVDEQNRAELPDQTETQK